jgi:RNA polymerase-binding transcription factor DksA
MPTDDTTDLVADQAARLNARRAELLARMTAIEADLDALPDPDAGERAIELEDDEVLEALGLGAQAELARIDAALARVAAGTYGVCAQCGAPIGAARLQALPAAPLCRDCAA